MGTLKLTKAERLRDRARQLTLATPIERAVREQAQACKVQIHAPTLQDWEAIAVWLDDPSRAQLPPGLYHVTRRNKRGETALVSVLGTYRWRSLNGYSWRRLGWSCVPHIHQPAGNEKGKGWHSGARRWQEVDYQATVLLLGEERARWFAGRAWKEGLGGVGSILAPGASPLVTEYVHRCMGWRLEEPGCYADDIALDGVGMFPGRAP